MQSLKHSLVSNAFSLIASRDKFAFATTDCFLPNRHHNPRKGRSEEDEEEEEEEEEDDDQEAGGMEEDEETKGL